MVVVAADTRRENDAQNAPLEKRNNGIDDHVAMRVKREDTMNFTLLLVFFSGKIRKSVARNSHRKRRPSIPPPPPELTGFSYYVADVPPNIGLSMTQNKGRSDVACSKASIRNEKNVVHSPISCSVLVQVLRSCTRKMSRNLHQLGGMQKEHTRVQESFFQGIQNHGSGQGFSF
jgi:hypothetical protein